MHRSRAYRCKAMVGIVGSAGMGLTALVLGAALVLEAVQAGRFGTVVVVAPLILASLLLLGLLLAGQAEAFRRGGPR